MDFLINLTAGQWHRQDTRGRMLLVIDTGAAPSIELRIDMPGVNDEQIDEARKGFKARLAAGFFSGVMMRAAVNTTARIVISENDIDYDFMDGATVKAEILGLPLPVSNDRGTPANPMVVTGADGGLPAAGLADAGPIDCGPVAVELVAANADRAELRVCNLGPDQIVLGAAGITWAKRAIVLDPGDIWIEDRAANLAIYAITAAGKTAAATIQEVTR